MATKRGTPRWRILLNRAGIVALACGLLWFAVEGGEYGTRALLAEKERRASLDADIQLLQQEIDSLQREKNLVLKNDAVLERIAREQYGMLRGDKEILFWMNDGQEDSDSAPPPVNSGRTLSKR